MNLTFPKLKWPWDEAQYKALQKWIDQMRDVFAGRISVRENLNVEEVVFEFVAGSTPSKRVSVTQRPMGVVQMGIEQIDPASNTPPVVTEAFSWTFADGSLSFPAYGTITGTARYRATVLVIKG